MINKSGLNQFEATIYEKLKEKLPATITGNPDAEFWQPDVRYAAGAIVVYYHENTTELDFFKCITTHTASIFDYSKWEITTSRDYSIFPALLAILSNIVKDNIDDFYKQLNVQTADELYLRKLASLVGYSWAESLSVEANRARLMSYEYRRKYRGTLDSIKNLARASINEESFYSNAENSNIKVYEGGENPHEPYLPGHVITLELPESFEILRLDIEEVRPAGTLLYFMYRILLDLVSSVSTWTPSTQYYIGNYVIFDNMIYQCLEDHISSDLFITDMPTKWILISVYSFEDLSFLTINFLGAKLLKETVAGDAPSLEIKVFPTWGYWTRLTDLWSRPICISSTMPGVNSISNNLLEYFPLRIKTIIEPFVFNLLNTDIITTWMIEHGISTEGLYTVVAADGVILSASLLTTSIQGFNFLSTGTGYINTWMQTNGFTVDGSYTIAIENGLIISATLEV